MWTRMEETRIRFSANRSHPCFPIRVHNLSAMVRTIYFSTDNASFCRSTAWAAARRAMGTRKGEQLT